MELIIQVPRFVRNGNRNRSVGCAGSKQDMEEILPHALLISGSNSQEIPWLGCDEISEPDLTLNSLGMTLLVSFESDGFKLSNKRFPKQCLATLR